MKNILITGGSGLVGSKLTKLLLEKNYSVSHLSRSKPKTNNAGVKIYNWDIKEGSIQDEAILSADCIVHLAGAGVADERWTASRKKTLLESRTQSAALLISKMKELNHKPELFISASAIGYYGNTGDKWVDETAGAGTDFLAKLCEEWEASAKEFQALEIPYNINRIGLVLSRDGGALAEMEKAIHLGVAGYLGNGKQYMSWVHINDLCRQFLHCIEGKAKPNEIYNAVAPNPEQNIDFTQKLSKAIGKGILLPVPSFALKLMKGEMSEMLLTGQRVSSKKIQSTGFEYKFSDLASALDDLYG